MKARVLYLILKTHWFALIASGEKTEEYRALSPFWKVRIEGRDYDEICFRKAYTPTTMRVEYLGWRVGQDDNGRACYILKLGRVLH